MGADVSRVRFDPLRDFAGVVLQQGRLLLDGDFNEYVALLDRRLRAETCDLTSFGPDPDHAGVAWVPRQTPDGFRVTASGGKLTIGRGRMYVDGLLAENHGVHADSGSTRCSPSAPGRPTRRTTSSRTGRRPTRSRAAARTSPTSTSGSARSPTSRIPTSSRSPSASTRPRASQTAWQVRAAAEHRQRDVRLRRRRHPGLARRDPPVGRPAHDRHDRRSRPTTTRASCRRRGGYRGLENQTYRVEVHDGGAPGTATFKWSRDNGSVAIPVVEMVSTDRAPARVGRQGRRAARLDRRLGRDPRRPLRARAEARRAPQGDGRRRRAHDHLHRRDPGRPAARERRDDAAKRHLRVRRWDQAGVGQGRRPARQLVDLDAPGATGADHRSGVVGDAGRARARRRRLVLDRVRRQRPLPRRRLLDLRRAHRRHVDRDPRPRRRRSASTTTTRGSARSPSRARRPTAAGCGRRSAAAARAATAPSA